ncbi:uncharacterized protein LOC130672758 [Microplitis mediator]|uniref:uncharacterized protein LOC130672758 n=1 Tax=Microplitis mediator TaxID=375433 RepID=UPI00255753F0|nr:uncharacterized protein LOC130672758 [Microplitis mediator]
MYKSIIFILVLTITIDKSYSIGFNPLTSLQQQLNTTIDAAKTTINDNLATAKNKINEAGVELKEAAESAGQAMYDQISTLINQLDNQFKELEKTAGEVDISECMALGNAKDMIALSLMVNVSNCIVEHLEFGDGFSESLNKVTNDVLDNLTSAQNEANKCFEDMSFKAIAQATVCASKVTAKTTWITVNSIPETATTIGKLTNEMSMLPINVPYCTVSNGIGVLPKKYMDLYNEVKECVDKKKSLNSN